MKQNTIRKTCQVVPVLLITGALAACDAHIEEPDKTVRPGHVLCVDGKAVPYSEYENSGKQAIAVVVPYLFGRGNRKETAMPSICGTSLPKPLLTVSVWNRTHPVTSPPTTATRTLLPFMARPM